MSERAQVTNAERISELDAITDEVERDALFQEQIADVDRQLNRDDLTWKQRTALHAVKERLFLQNGASTAVRGGDGVFRHKR